MFAALKSHRKDPQRDLCRWNAFVAGERSVLQEGFQPTVASPVVFHLHGHVDVPESVVLTEDDYLDFLVSTSKESIDPKPIPSRIEQAFTRASLLFLGYRLPDLEFRVLLRSLIPQLKVNMARNHISILQVSETVSEKEINEVQKYLTRYCGAGPFHFKVYWGEASQFLAELKARWKASGNDD
jgi:hypothetical protein